MARHSPCSSNLQCVSFLGVSVLVCSYRILGLGPRFIVLAVTRWHQFPTTCWMRTFEILRGIVQNTITFPLRCQRRTLYGVKNSADFTMERITLSNMTSRVEDGLWITISLYTPRVHQILVVNSTVHPWVSSLLWIEGSARVLHPQMLKVYVLLSCFLVGSWLNLAYFLQSVFIAARARGLETVSLVRSVCRKTNYDLYLWL